MALAKLATTVVMAWRTGLCCYGAILESLLVSTMDTYHSPPRVLPGHLSPTSVSLHSPGTMVESAPEEKRVWGA